jgi:hypothetical protein
MVAIYITPELINADIHGWGGGLVENRLKRLKIKGQSRLEILD